VFLAAKEWTMTVSRDQKFTIIPEPELRSFQARVSGRCIGPGDGAYDRARHVWNTAIDRHPVLVVQPADATDVISALEFARVHDLPVATRGGGHSPAGYGTVDDGLVVDLSGMKRVVVDAETHVARADAGLTWREYNARTHAHGLATPGVDVAAVGIGGSTLSGGMGWLMRKHGMTIDNVLAVELVTADGQAITATAAEHPDLFWALRGGGGNFGIATAFLYRLHDVDTVLGGAIVHPATHRGLRAYAEAVADAPDELTTLSFVTKAPPLPFLPAEAHGTPVHLILPCYAGDPEAGQRALGPLRALTAKPLADTTSVTTYTALYDFTDMAAVSRPHAVRNAYLRELADEAIELILDFVDRSTSPLGLIALRELGGAMARVPVDATAFAHRDKGFYIAADNSWENDPEPERHVAWANDFLRAVAPYTEGAYAGFMDDEGEERLRAAYPRDTLRRLASVKRMYDADNLFRQNPNIRPA
jgi:FAD/FMN-containing dehydrogenase